MTPNSATSQTVGEPGCIDAVSTFTSVGVPGATTAPLRGRAVRAPGWSLAAALLGFFVVTLDAVIVNVALPDVRRELAGGMSGLQWVVDGYTLMFAALLLSAGSLSDRIGARRAFGAGMVVFVLASVGCGLAPGLGMLVAARFVQGSAAAAMMPSSMALCVLQARGRHPMMPLDLFRSRTVCMAVVAGFAFMVGYYGLPFMMSLYLQELRGASALGAGIAFVPMMLTGAVLTPFTARLAERFGARALVTKGLICMTAGLIVISLMPATAPVAVLSVLMMLVGLAGPLVMPPVMALLLQAVPARRAGVASGVFNTSRQIGGALAIAVFGALLADRETFLHGLRVSLIIAAAIALATAGVSFLFSRSSHTSTPEGGARK
jgi:MFS family permease